MAKRQRKSEQEYLRARSALMRSIQRTNKAFGSNMTIGDIVNVPTPAQAKKMSAAELRQMTKRIKQARTEKGEQMTFVPTGAGTVTRVPTKDYNAAMANLGKRNKALRSRLEAIESAKVPMTGGARPMRKKDVPGGYTSKIIPLDEIDPMTAFIGGKARGNVDEIVKRFSERGRVFSEAPRKWRDQDEAMRRGLMKMVKASGNAGMIARFESLTNEQLLWAVYERNLNRFLEGADYLRYRALGGDTGGDSRAQQDSLAASYSDMVEDIINVASEVSFR